MCNKFAFYMEVIYCPVQQERKSDRRPTEVGWGRGDGKQAG